VVAAGVWLARWAREPDFPAWTFAFPLVVAFLLTNKVYSPQYGLWLLPLFALALPNLPLFIAFQAAGFHGAPLGAFELAVVARDLILVLCLVAWVLGARGRHAVGARARSEDAGGALRRPVLEATT
jgi:hypothetical protein